MRIGVLPHQHRTWEKVRAEGRCRICAFVRDPRMSDPPKSGWITGHHIVPKSRGGTNSEDNIVPLCFRCHKIVDSNKPCHTMDRIALRSRLRSLLTVQEIAYCERSMGAGWLDRNYPNGGAS